MSSTTINHVFLTRFNLPSGGMENAIRAREGWLRERVVLFEQYCLASMRQQVESDFSWIIYFDPASPQWLLEWIREVNEDHIFVPVFRESVDDEALRSDLRAVVGTPRARLLTTNLDNDDGLSKEFTARIRAAVSALDDRRHAVYVSQGLIKGSGQLYVRTDKNNAFCSVVESWQQPVSCWSNWHNLLGQSMPVHEIGGGPGWLQVVHGTNVSNRIRGRRVNPDGHKTVFPGLLDDIPHPTVVQLMWDNTTMTVLRSGRETARAIAKWTAMKLLGRDGLDRAKARLASMHGTLFRRGA